MTCGLHRNRDTNLRSSVCTFTQTYRHSTKQAFKPPSSPSGFTSRPYAESRSVWHHAAVCRKATLFWETFMSTHLLGQTLGRGEVRLHWRHSSPPYTLNFILIWKQNKQEQPSIKIWMDFLQQCLSNVFRFSKMNTVWFLCCSLTVNLNLSQSINKTIINSWLFTVMYWSPQFNN